MISVPGITDDISYLQRKYIIRQRRISYRVSDISLKSAAKRDIICSINKNLKETIPWQAILLLFL